MKTSQGEQKVINILKAANVSFLREVTMPDMVTYKQGRPRYDFVVYKDNEYKDIDYIIEYDGIQHFEPKSVFKSADFKYRQATDRLKNSYCLAHDIPLYRIPYTDFNSIHSLQDILSRPSYRVTTKWHNDNLRENLTNN